MVNSNSTTLVNIQPKYSAASAVAKAVAKARQEQHKNALDTQTQNFKDIEKQFDELSKINLTNITEAQAQSHITALQKLLGRLLNNIILTNDPDLANNDFINFYYNHPESTFNYYYKKNKTTASAKTTDDTPNIFSIPSDRENLDKNKYGKFLIFMITESLKINTQFANASASVSDNNVDILTVHLMEHISTEDYKAIQ